MGVLWVYKCLAGRWDIDQCCSAIIRAIMQDRPQAVWLERFLGWEGYDKTLLRMANELRLQHLPVEWKKLDRREDAKMLRIGGTLPWLTSRKLWLFAGMDRYDKVRGQLLKWPKISGHDDDADCLGHLCEVPHGAAGIPAPPSPGTMADRVREMHRERAMAEGAERFQFGGTGSGIVS
jgi:hypothetical protein